MSTTEVLVARGDLTVWILPDLAWHAAEGTGRCCQPQIFTDTEIQTVLTLKVHYRLTLRAAQGRARGGDPAGWPKLAGQA